MLEMISIMISKQVKEKLLVVETHYEVFYSGRSRMISERGSIW